MILSFHEIEKKVRERNDKTFRQSPQEMVQKSMYAFPCKWKKVHPFAITGKYDGRTFELTFYSLQLF